MPVILFLLLVAIALTFPYFFAFLLIPNLFLGIFLSILQISIALLPYFHPRCRLEGRRPLVSIFVPTYNEPPAMVIHTLEVLSRLRYGNFKVMVIDNNTQNENVWRPVQSFVKILGEKFQFFHVERLSGFKAGALNYLMEHLDVNAEYVAVIDADYLVKPDFIKVSLSYFCHQNVALVQFPQSYRNCVKRNQPVADEYRHFFGIYMNMSNYLDCVPSTGTVSVYRASVLRKIGGFRGEMLTEDADVGLRIYEAGYRGIYVDQSIGFGLMPHDLASYKKQKWRWAFGNAQSMTKLFSLLGKIPFRSWFGFFLNLTAWDHFNLLPFGMLAAYAVLVLTNIPENIWHRKSFEIALFSVVSTLVSKQILFFLALQGKKNFLRRSVKALLVHMGMTLVYSEAWFFFLLRAKFAFERTNKFILSQMPGFFCHSYKEVMLGTWFFTGALGAMEKGETIVGMSFLLVALIPFCIYYVHHKVCATKPYSKKIIYEIEKKYGLHLRDGPYGPMWQRIRKHLI